MEEDPREETPRRLARFKALQTELIKTLATLDSMIEQTERELELELEAQYGTPETPEERERREHGRFYVPANRRAELFPFASKPDPDPAG